MFAFFTNSSAYLWNSLPENVTSYLVSTGSNISGFVWDRLPESVRRYVSKKIDKVISDAIKDDAPLSEEGKIDLDEYLKAMFAKMDAADSDAQTNSPG